MHRILARRLGALVATVLAAASLAHVVFTAALAEVPYGAAVRNVPAYLSATFLRGDLGETPGGGCDPADLVALCGSWGRGPVAEMLRERGLVDLQLVLGGMVLGTLAGVLAGRHCAAHPRTAVTRALHAAIAFLLACPPYFLGFVVLMWFAWNSGEYALPFVSGQGDYVPFGEDPLQFARAMWAPWVVVALPLAAFVARIAEASLREILDEDYIRTARAKGLGPALVVNRHAVPVAVPAVAAMTGVNVSTMLINAAALEYGFALPGMFSTIRGAIFGHDVAVLQAIVLEGVVLAVIANFLADAVQARFDPRVG